MPPAARRRRPPRRAACCSWASRPPRRTRLSGSRPSARRRATCSRPPRGRRAGPCRSSSRFRSARSSSRACGPGADCRIARPTTYRASLRPSPPRPAPPRPLRVSPPRHATRPSAWRCRNAIATSFVGYTSTGVAVVLGSAYSNQNPSLVQSYYVATYQNALPLYTNPRMISCSFGGQQYCTSMSIAFDDAHVQTVLRRAAVPSCALPCQAILTPHTAP